MLPFFRSVLLAVSVSLCCAAAWAQPARNPTAAADAGGPDWASLTAQQRAALAPLQRDWAKLDATRRAKWLEVAARFPGMPAEEQQRVQVRMTEWARMTPAERGRARLSFQESKQLTGPQKQQRWEAYQALPPDERKALAARSRPGGEPSHAARVGPAPTDSLAPKRADPVARAAPQAATVKPVAPIILQAKPGATTTLMTKPAAPPAHQQPGQPKIAAQPGQVDRRTLLPQSGPQAAASAPRRP